MSGHRWPPVQSGVSHPGAFGLVGNGASTMISRSSRLLHAALVVVCGAAIVYAPAQSESSLRVYGIEATLPPTDRPAVGTSMTERRRFRHSG